MPKKIKSKRRSEAQLARAPETYYRRRYDRGDNGAILTVCIPLSVLTEVQAFATASQCTKTRTVEMLLRAGLRAVHRRPAEPRPRVFTLQELASVIGMLERKSPRESRDSKAG